MTVLEHALQQQRVVERLWQRDASLWHPSAETQAGIARRLGWLEGPDDALLAQVHAIAEATRRPALLVTPDDAGGGARLWIDGASAQIALLDSWAPAAVGQAFGHSRRTVVLAADRASPALEALLAVAAAHGVQQAAVVAPPALLGSMGARSRKLAAVPAGARFGAVGSYGLLAAALSGRDTQAIAAGANRALEACRDTSSNNPGLRLGAALAALAQHGHDIVLLRSAAAERPVCEWIAGLLAGALSKHRRGFVPIVASGRQPALPMQHPAQIVLRAPWDAAAPPQAPRIELCIAGDRDIAAMAVIWQIAVALAAIVIGVNPFDEPDTIALERRMGHYAGGDRPPAPDLPPAVAPELLNIPAAARWLVLVPYFAVNNSNRTQLDILRSGLEQRSGKPAALVEPLRHGWATQLLHAGRPDGFAIALAPPRGTTRLDTLARARFELDVAAWRRMGRAFAVLRQTMNDER